MKKVLFMILGLTMLSMSAMAQEFVNQEKLDFSVKTVLNVATFEDADTTTGVGIQGDIDNLLLENLVLSASVNYYDLGKADLYRIPMTAGYDIEIKDVTVTPKVGLVIDALDLDNANTETSTGFLAGVDASVKITENLDLLAGVSYVANTVEEVNTSLDGYTFTAGVSYNF